MTTFRSDEAFVGLVALAVAVWLGLRLRRALSEDWLPVGRGRLVRQERPGAYRTLLVLYVAAALLMAFIGLDLLIGLELGN
jgi:uncharacterized iron-regulated membrane protein